MRTLHEIAEVANDARVIGDTIGGSEQPYPPSPFAPVFNEAVRRGFRVSAHAGEVEGPRASGAPDLEVERIGHGVRSVEDPALLAHLVETQIPLEVCPTSNVRTGVVTDWQRHPVRDLIDAGHW